MNLVLRLCPCAAGESLPLLRADVSRPVGLRAHRAVSPPHSLPFMPVGIQLVQSHESHDARFAVTGHIRLPSHPHALCCPLLTARTDMPPGDECALETRKEGRSLAWVTLSDKGFRGEREDKSGPAIAEMVAQTLPLCHSQGFLLPDEPGMLRALLTDLALTEGYDLICTTGGTGLSPRDISPQVTAGVIDLPLPGLRHAMLAAGLAVTPHAAISRAEAGVLGQSIIINLPGSHKAVRENLAAVLPALPHALDKLHSDPTDCGG
ncbi:MAG: MogA/MoaB family molybdenum cofactor biosynthesis protein [Desulfovibrio sp.]|nr:MogA/MoaB family molybdenum cofactor biosynthesis protein [Desulfovibrio sp.]